MKNQFNRSARKGPALLATSLWIVVFLAGCSLPTDLGIPEIPGIIEQRTATPHRTLAAIETMLTATAAIPTATHTPPPTFTPLPGPTSTATPELPILGQIGQPLAAKSIGLMVRSSIFAGELGEQTAAEGRTFLDLEVTIEYLADDGGLQSESTLSYTSYYFTLTDTAGTQYNPFAFAQDALTAGIPPRLLGGDLLPGEMVRGHVVFEVPTEPGPLTLTYTPALPTTDVLPPVFTVPLAQEHGSIPSDSIPATGAISVNSDAWLSEALPGQDQLAQSSGVSLKIEMVRSAVVFEGKRAPTGSRFLILDTVIQNLTHPQVPYNPQYFKLKDEQGYEYGPIILPGDIMLQAGSLTEGRVVKGTVVFLLPLEVERAGVIYKPQVLTEEWNALRIAISVPDR